MYNFMKNKSTKRPRGLSVYANLSARRKIKKDERARRRAEYLATLPKHPVKRLLARLHPKRVIRYWFSWQGLMMTLKILAVLVVIFGILVGAAFAYYRQQLADLNPKDLAKHVQSTVTKYYDRNGILLWSDTGTGDYKLVVQSQDIATVMKQATVAIEDKDFYREGGISVPGIIRATMNNLTHSGDTQGASTLTQQLIKNVFFASDAANNRLDFSRKVKEAFLAVEAERMYSKDQILTLYLNEVPYGGRRNGVESAAETYFGVAAKDLTLPQAAMIAAIPQSPSYYNPYNIAGNQALVNRQHTVLNDMAEQGYITKQQAEDAKKVDVLDMIHPELSANENIKAPHFIQAVRTELESKFGVQLVRAGGLTVKTTLDWRLQQIAEGAVKDSYNKYIAAHSSRGAGADNIAFAAVDPKTGQILAEVGSYNYSDPNYGATDAARSLLNPGSSIKIADYAGLMALKGPQTFGGGSILQDKDVSSIYGVKLNNFDDKFLGNMTLRDAFADSRNTTAVQAAYIQGLSNMMSLAQQMGDTSYGTANPLPGHTECTGTNYGLSAAIGTCYVKLIQHVNAYATLANNGVANQESDVLSVTNSQGQTLEQWQQNSKQVVDPQVAYIIDDILSDPNARKLTFGNPAFYPGFTVPGVKTATKTGTTDAGGGKIKDGWMMSYSPRVAAGVWAGQHLGHVLTTYPDYVTGTVISEFMNQAHQQVFAKDGSWKSGDWFQQPSGVQRLSMNGKSDLYPSWYQKPAHPDGEQITFDKVSKKKATDCTPDGAKITQTVQSFTDPITKQTTYSAPDGYDPSNSDDVHQCSDAKPFITLSTQNMGSGKYTITATVNQGTFSLQQLDITANGKTIMSQPVSNPGDYGVTYTFTSSGDETITATITDQGYYTNSVSKTVTVTLSFQPGGGGNFPFAVTSSQKSGGRKSFF